MIVPYFKYNDLITGGDERQPMKSRRIFHPVDCLVMRLRVKLGRCDCWKKGTWYYAPARKNENPWACDECVPRGCSCNLELRAGVTEMFDDDGITINPISDYWQPHDLFGRQYPCCEWLYVGDEEF